MASTFISLPDEGGGDDGVISFNGRTGIVVPEVGDYAAFYQPLDADLTAYAALATTGMVARTGAGTVSTRTITGTAPIALSNGDGVAGNPTISLNNTAVVAGSYTNSSLTVDAQGRLTAASSGTAPVTSVTGTSPITSSGGATPAIGFDYTAFQPISTHLFIADDFITGNPGGTGLAWAFSGTGATGNTSPGSTTSANPGVINLICGTTTTGYAYASGTATSSAFKAGGGATYYETIISMSAVSDGTDTFTIWVGMAGAVPGEANDAIYFKYTSTVNSGNWAGHTRRTGVGSTIVNSSIPGSTSFVRLGWAINAAGTSVEFFINGASIGTSSATIPVNGLTFVWEIVKSAGTTSRTLTVDAYRFQQILTTPR